MPSDWKNSRGFSPSLPPFSYLCLSLITLLFFPLALSFLGALQRFSGSERAAHTHVLLSLEQTTRVHACADRRNQTENRPLTRSTCCSTADYIQTGSTLPLFH